MVLLAGRGDRGGELCDCGTTSSLRGDRGPAPDDGTDEGGEGEADDDVYDPGEADGGGVSNNAAPAAAAAASVESILFTLYGRLAGAGPFGDKGGEETAGGDVVPSMAAIFLGAIDCLCMPACDIFRCMPLPSAAGAGFASANVIAGDEVELLAATKLVPDGAGGGASPRNSRPAKKEGITDVLGGSFSPTVKSQPPIVIPLHGRSVRNLHK